MIIDVNACLGHYPFRRLRHNTAAGMIDLMDRNGIARALVSSLHAVFYRDAHQGNEELVDEIRPHRGRLIAVATVNPRYAGWERDFDQAVGEWQVRAIALVPEHHGYALSDAQGRAALLRAGRHNLPVLLMQRFEDRRQRHAWDRAEDLRADDLIDAARAHPDLRFILANWLGLDGRRLLEAGLKGRCLIDFARMQVIYRKEVPRLIDTLGIESIAFGSHMPFDYVGGSLIKLAGAQRLWPGEFEQIAWRNAARFLGADF